MLSIAKWGGMFRVWNEIELLQIEESKAGLRRAAGG